MAKDYFLFVALFALGTIAAVFIDAIWGVYLYIYLYFAAPWDKWWGGMLPDVRWGVLVSTAILIGYLVRWNRYSSQRIRDSKPILLFGAFVLLMVLVGFIAVWPEAHWGLVDKQAKVLFFVILMYKAVNTPRRLEGLLWVYCFGVFYVSYTAWGVGRTSYGRLEGVGTADSSDANDIAAILLTGVPLLTFFAMEAKKVALRVVAILGLPFVLNALILVNSRGAIVGLCVSMAIYLSAILLSGGKSKAFKFKVLCGILSAVVLFLYLADPTFWARQSSLTAGNETGDNQDYGRFQLWKHAFFLALDHPLGVGGWGFTYLAPTFLPPELIGSSSVKAVHSTLFEALSAYGFVGLFLLLWLLYSSFRELRGAIDPMFNSSLDYLRLQRVALISSFAGFLTAALFIDRLYCEVLFYFITIFSLFRALYLRPRSALSSRGVSVPSSAQAGTLGQQPTSTVSR